MNFPSTSSFCTRTLVTVTHQAVFKRHLHFTCLTMNETTALPMLPTKKRAAGDARYHFADYLRVRCSGGKGGDGMFSFLRIFKNPFAGPDGGDGGNGAHVIFQADTSVRSLNHLHSVVQAPSGKNGRNKSCHGANAEHMIIKVPVGTMFTRLDNDQVVCDLKRHGSIFLAARGGAGGHGNEYYLSNEVRAPTKAQAGAQGEQFVYDVELRVMAHAGLVGFPNAGKSTLLRAVSRARPKVAAYPFTTLNPYVGMIEYDDYEQLALADIPGLISGAHRNEGLGFSFLKHVERCLGLFYVLDLSLSDPWFQLEELKSELEAYKPGLSAKPNAIVGNKIDLQQSEENLRKLRERTELAVFPISAKYRIGLHPLLIRFRQIYDQHKAEWFEE